MRSEEAAEVVVDMFRVVVIGVSVVLSGGEQVAAGLAAAEVVAAGPVAAAVSEDLVVAAVAEVAQVVAGKNFWQ